VLRGTVGTTTDVVRLVPEIRMCLVLLLPYNSTARLALVFFFGRRGSGIVIVTERFSEFQSYDLENSEKIPNSSLGIRRWHRAVWPRFGRKPASRFCTVSSWDRRASWDTENSTFYLTPRFYPSIESTLQI
jgi:hypothetical protein